MFKLKTCQIHQLKKITEVLKDMFKDYIITADVNGIEFFQNFNQDYIIRVHMYPLDYEFTAITEDEACKNQWSFYFKAGMLYKNIKSLTTLDHVEIKNSSNGLCIYNQEKGIELNTRYLNKESIREFPSQLLGDHVPRSVIILESKPFSKCLRDVKANQYETLTFNTDTQVSYFYLSASSNLQDYKNSMTVVYAKPGLGQDVRCTHNISTLMLYVKSVSLHKNIMIYFYKEFTVFQHLLFDQGKRIGKMSFVSKNTS